jgi:hypothetical protein
MSSSIGRQVGAIHGLEFRQVVLQSSRHLLIARSGVVFQLGIELVKASGRRRTRMQGKVEIEEFIHESVEICRVGVHWTRLWTRNEE